MSESAGSCATLCQANVLNNLNDYALRKEKTAQNRGNDALKNYGALNFTGYSIQNGLNKLAAMQNHNVCYLA